MKSLALETEYLGDHRFRVVRWFRDQLFKGFKGGKEADLVSREASMLHGFGARDFIALGISSTFLLCAVVLVVTRPESDVTKLLLGALIVQTGRVIEHLFSAKHASQDGE